MKKIFCNTARCTGCEACVIACAVEHSKSKNIFKAIKEDPLPRARRSVQVAGGKAILSIACRHCNPAPCVQACMSGSMFKDDKGETVHDLEKCVGCGMCMMVCPFGAISKQKQIALKCDLCPERDDGDYACVKACPTKALFVGTIEEFEKKVGT